MLTSAIENLLNRGLPRSPRARQLCAELAGSRIAVDVRGFTRLLVSSDGQQLRISAAEDSEAQACISGGPLGLAALAGEDAAAVIRRGDVQVTGDTALATKMRELLVLLRPDPEEELALALGDAPAHQLGRAARALAGWTRRATDTAMRNVAEYLAHERRDLVSRGEGRQLLQGIDALRDDVARLEARVALLAERVAARGGERPGS